MPISGARLSKDQTRPIAAEVVWPPPVPQGTVPPDIAVLLLKDEAARPQREMQFADWPEDDTVAWTVGFPRAQAKNQPHERVAHVNLPGKCWTFSEKPPTIAFNSTLSVPANDAAAWKGLSGGPLVAGNLILGVMRRYPDGWDPASVLEAEPIGALLSQDQHLCNLLGATPPLPKARNIIITDIPPEFRKLSQIIHFFDRTTIAGSVIDTIVDATANGTSVEIIAYGQEQDRCGDLVMRIHEEALPRLFQDRTSGLLAVSWPQDSNDPVSAVKTMCRNTARNMLLSPPWPEKWEEIAAQLKGHSVAPWFHVSLPAKPTPLDFHLITEWRQCWAGVQRARGEAAGYVLTFEGRPADGNLLEQLKKPATGLLSKSVYLGPHSLEHVKAWPDDIRNLILLKVLQSDRPVELQSLARSLEPHVTSRGWINFTQKDLLWLLEGQI